MQADSTAHGTKHVFEMRLLRQRIPDLVAYRFYMRLTVDSALFKKCMVMRRDGGG